MKKTAIYANNFNRMAKTRVYNRAFSGLRQSATNRLSIAFSGCGWLTPYHLGVLKTFQEQNLLNHFSFFAGTSGGSLAALIASTTQEFDENYERALTLADDKAFFKDIDYGLRAQILNSLNNTESYLGCNHKLHVVVSRVYPFSKWKCLVVSKFDSNVDVINAVTASCFIPFYNNGKLTTRLPKVMGSNPASKHINDEIYERSPLPKSSHHYLHDSWDNNNDIVIDGFAAGGMMPPIGDILVSPFSKRLFQLEGRNRIPHINLELLLDKSNPILLSSPCRPVQLPRDYYNVRSLAYYALFPTNKLFIERLYDSGRYSCEVWLNQLHTDGMTNKEYLTYGAAPV